MIESQEFFDRFLCRYNGDFRADRLDRRLLRIRKSFKERLNRANLLRRRGKDIEDSGMIREKSEIRLLIHNPFDSRGVEFHDVKLLYKWIESLHANPILSQDHFDHLAPGLVRQDRK